MKGFKSKKGISLIVLVITIIVMIILAAAIILSISNSGIMDKANKAKTDSDAANLKEYVNVLEAEWELGTKETSKVAYVNEKLEEKGYTSAYMTSDETLYTNLQANTKAALKSGIKIGDKVEGYTLDTSKTSYTTSGNENTAPDGENEQTVGEKQTVLQVVYSTWKYIGIGENGKLLISPDMVNSITDNQTVMLSGKGGFVYGPNELNQICESIYSTSKGTARSIDIDDITRILDYTGPVSSYESGMDYNNYYLFEKLTIDQIAELKGERRFDGESPDGVTAVGSYLANAYDIHKTSKYILKSVTDEETREKLVDFVYSDVSYWLASTSCFPRYGGSDAWFGMRYVGSNFVTRGVLWFAIGGGSGRAYSNLVRPVVEIDPSVSVSYSNGTLTLN